MYVIGGTGVGGVEALKVEYFGSEQSERGIPTPLFLAKEALHTVGG
jgi:hypothetical protein